MILLERKLKKGGGIVTKSKESAELTYVANKEIQLCTFVASQHYVCLIVTTE